MHLIVFLRPLGLRLMVQQRIFNSTPERAFVFHTSDAAKQFLLQEGTDPKYGARHLKRAIERLLVQPMSNLIATDQVHSGDWLRIDFDAENKQLSFMKEAEGLPVKTMAELVDTSITMPIQTVANAAQFEASRVQNARSRRA